MSLIITPELCRSYGACKKGISFLKKYYPQGFSVSDVYYNKINYIPTDLILWGYHNLPFDIQEQKMCEDFLEIIDSKNSYFSHHIINCNNIVDSSYCKNSNNIKKSSDISNSNNVKDSQNINNCLKVIKSSNIYDSNYIYKSDNIKNSYCIYNSQNISNSFLSYDNSNSYNLIFSYGQNNTNNKIFCNENNKKNTYSIFNRPVDKNIFIRKYKELEEKLKVELKNFYDNYSETTLTPFLITFKNFCNNELLWLLIFDILSPTKQDKQIMYDVCLSEIIFEI